MFDMPTPPNAIELTNIVKAKTKIIKEALWKILTSLSMRYCPRNAAIAATRVRKRA